MVTVTEICTILQRLLLLLSIFNAIPLAICQPSQIGAKSLRCKVCHFADFFFSYYVWQEMEGRVKVSSPIFNSLSMWYVCNICTWKGLGAFKNLLK